MSTQNVVFMDFFFFFGLGFTVRQDYFTHFEPSLSKGEAKTGDPREIPPSSRTWLVSRDPSEARTNHGVMTSSLGL